MDKPHLLKNCIRQFISNIKDIFEKVQCLGDSKSLGDFFEDLIQKN